MPLSKYISLFLFSIIFLPFKGEYAFDIKIYHEAQRNNLHDSWDELLQRYVDEAGFVDYKSWKENPVKLASYLTLLSKNTPDESWSVSDSKAYYINLYNAATVALILDNYPLKSIKDLKRPWGQEFIQQGSEKISLNEVEHRILRKMDDPRIHFAINCASFSCPKLRNTAFRATQLEEQLESATKDFIRDRTRNKISARSVELSRIFKWYKSDFTNQGTSLTDYLRPYVSVPLNEEVQISYLSYNWNLNERTTRN